MSKTKSTKKYYHQNKCDELLNILKTRFEKNMNRHKDIKWAKVLTKLEKNNDKLWSLNEMERTGGEPDVVGYDKKTGEYIFYDCSIESPNGRRSFCYDRAALDARKENKPKDNAVDVATAMGIELLTEEQYRELQKLGAFDLKTSSWVKLRIILENSAEPYSAIAVMILFLFTTTERNRTMPPEVFVAR